MAQPSAAAVIETRGLTKRYRGGQLAVDGLDLAVPRRQRLRLPRAQRLGQDHHHPHADGPHRRHGRHRTRPRRADAAGRRTVLPRVGALIEGPALYGFLPGADNLLGTTPPTRPPIPRTRRARVDAALERVGLSAAAGKKAKAYSLGHEAAARPRRRAPPAARTAGPGRADQRPRPAGHARNPFTGPGVGGGRHHGLPLLPPPRRDRAGLHARGRDGPRPARHPGHRSPRLGRGTRAAGWR